MEEEEAAGVKILCIVNSLEVGGAERLTVDLAATLAKTHDVEVVTLGRLGELAEELDSRGVLTRTASGGRWLPSPRQLLALLSHVKVSRPDIIQTRLYRADLLGGWLGLRARVPVVWGVHSVNLGPGFEKASTRWTMRACARVSSRFPSKIVYDSDMSRSYHEVRGYTARPGFVIPNGIDTTRFRPDLRARARFRARLGVAEEEILVGWVGRDHPVKSPAAFLKAIEILQARGMGVHAVLAGRGIVPENPALARVVERLPFPGHVHLIGPFADVASMYPALDILALSSTSESWPLVVGEAMSAGVPVVATAVGDVGIILEGLLPPVPPGNPEALADGLTRLVTATAGQRRALGERCRSRIVEAYSFDRMFERYQTLYEEVISDVRDHGTC